MTQYDVVIQGIEEVYKKIMEGEQNEDNTV